MGSFLSVVKTNFILLPIHSLIYLLFYVIHKVFVVRYFILCCSVFLTGTQPKNLIWLQRVKPFCYCSLMTLDIIIIPLAFGQKRHTPLRSAISTKQYALWRDFMQTICGPISGRGILVEILHLSSDSPNDRALSTQPRVVFIKSQLLRHWHVGLRKRTGGWQRRKDCTLVNGKAGMEWKTAAGLCHHKITS